MLSWPAMSADPAARPATLSLADRVGRLAGVRGWWLSAAIWGALALLAALLVEAQIVWAWAPPGPVLGVGRLLAVYRLAARLGAFALPLMALLARAPAADADRAEAQPLGWALLLWNSGLLVAVLGVLTGWMRPEPWAPQPAPADLLLLAGAVAWLRRVWRLAGPQPEGAPRAAVAAGIALLACLALGGILVQALGGVGQALGGALMGRGLDDLFLLTAAFGAGATLLPRLSGRPLFGRHVWTWGLWAWLAWAASRLPADLAPDLLGSGATRAMDALAPLGLVPLVLLAVSLAGCFVGAPLAEEARARLRHPEAVLIQVGLAVLILWRLIEAATSPAATRLLQFTAAAPRAWELPSWAGWWCLSAGLVWRLAGGRALPRGGWIAAVAALGALSQGLLMLPLALVNLAAGPSSEILALEAGLRLPPTLLLLAAWTLPAALLWRAGRSPVLGAPAADEVRSPDRRRIADEGPGWYGASVAALLVAGLLLAVIVPLASQGGALGPSGAVPEADLARGDDLAPGRAAYVADGCVFCHSRRIREGWDPETMGPATRPAAQGLVPSLAGLRRSGPDLSWLGERLVDAPERVAVHALGGRPAFPWRFDASGAGPEGADLMDYLAALRPAVGGAP